MELPPVTTPDKHRRISGNLRPAWPPGVGGNPAGRPKRKTFTELAHEYLSQPVNGESAQTRMERLAKAIIDRAIGGDMQSAKLILDRLDPAPRYSLTVNNNVRAPIMDTLDRLSIGRAEPNGLGRDGR